MGDDQTVGQRLNHSLRITRPGGIKNTNRAIAVAYVKRSSSECEMCLNQSGSDEHSAQSRIHSSSVSQNPSEIKTLSKSGGNLSKMSLPSGVGRCHLTAVKSILKTQCEYVGWLVVAGWLAGCCCCGLALENGDAD